MNVNYSPAYTANVRAVTCNLQSQLYVCKTTPHVFTRVSLLNRQFHETFEESRFLYKSIMYYRLCLLFQGKSFSKVQVSRLGRSKSLPLLSGCDKTSTSCVAQDVLPPDSTRW